MKTFSRWLLVAIVPSVALSHHSFPETYNTSRVVEIFGEVVDLRWANPHVEFAVVSAQGERWEVQSNGIGGLEQRGLTLEQLAPGRALRVAGFPARNGERKMYSSNVQLTDGREIVLRPGSGRRWTSE